MKHQKNHPHLINESIYAKQVLVLDQNHKAIGTYIPRVALSMAKQQGVDLILIAPKANPPVCLIGDYGKYLYSFRKQEHHPKQSKQKEIQLSANIFEHDLDIKVRHTKEFLAEGHAVKVILKLRGREKAHPEIGKQQMKQFLTKVFGTDKPFQNLGTTFMAYLNQADLAIQSSSRIAA